MIALPSRAALMSAAAPCALAFAGFVFYTVCFYPGSMSPDSAHAWWLARGAAGDNVQGIGLVWLFRLTGNLVQGPGGPFVVIHALFWAGFATIAMAASPRPAVRAGIVALAGFAPVCCVLLSHVWSDVALMAALTAALAALLRYRDTAHCRWLAIALLLLWWALILRHNALAAVVPLFCYATYLWNLHERGRRAASRSHWRMIAPAAVAACLWLASVAADRTVDRLVNAFPSLALWDLAAISLKVDAVLLPDDTHGKGLDIADLRRAYVPYANVPLFIGTRAGVGTPFPDANDPINAEIAAAWRQAIRDHPEAYLSHRWRVTRGLFGTRPRAWPHELVYVDGEADYRDNPHVAANATAAHAFMIGMFEAARATVALAAWPYLLLALAALVAAWRRRTQPNALAAMAVLLSGLLYAAPLPFIAPSAELRYLGWTCLAATLGAGLGFTRPRVPAPPEPRASRACPPVP